MFNPYLISRLEVLVKVFAVLAVLTGLTVMLGWLFKIYPLTSLLPNYASMKFNTALAFALCGFALLVTKQHGIGKALATLVNLIGLLSLAQYLFGWQLGIDELFVAQLQNEAELYPGRMSPITALLFSS
jgi:hypothetical protein